MSTQAHKHIKVKFIIRLTYPSQINKRINIMLDSNFKFDLALSLALKLAFNLALGLAFISFMWF